MRLITIEKFMTDHQASINFTEERRKPLISTHGITTDKTLLKLFTSDDWCLIAVSMPMHISYKSAPNQYACPVEYLEQMFYLNAPNVTTLI